MKKALVTGISGQAGSYMAELLLSKGYDVWGTVRRSSSLNTPRIDHIIDRLNLRFSDLTDSNSTERLIREVVPDEIYAFGAQSHVRVSFDVPIYTAEATAVGTLRLLEAARTYAPNARIVQASSSEMFGSEPAPQNEDTRFHPRSPYGIAKVFSYHAAINYRESYNMHISNSIFFNMESPRRGDTFVTKKIVKAAVRILQGKQKNLILGNLDSLRDWGFSKEYMEAAWLMAQQPKPDDYVIATGETHTVREFLDEAFGYLGLDWQNYVVIDSKYFRPAEVDVLLGDASKARRVLGWEAKTKFKELVRLMIDAELGDQ